MGRQRNSNQSLRGTTAVTAQPSGRTPNRSIFLPGQAVRTSLHAQCPALVDCWVLYIQPELLLWGIPPNFALVPSFKHPQLEPSHVGPGEPPVQNADTAHFTEGCGGLQVKYTGGESGQAANSRDLGSMSPLKDRRVTIWASNVEWSPWRRLRPFLSRNAIIRTRRGNVNRGARERSTPHCCFQATHRLSRSLSYKPFPRKTAGPTGRRGEVQYFISRVHM